VEIGARSVGEHWELAEASDYIATELEASGFVLERQGFEVGDVVVQNLGALVPGSDLGEQSIVVGAHYDTAAGDSGADSNATGVAALLALADAFKHRAPRRKFRFVAYGLGQAPHFASETMGSLRHAKALAAEGEKVKLMLSLDSLGNFAGQAGSQRPLEGIERALPATGNFLLVLGGVSSRVMAEELGAHLGRGTGLEIAVRSLREAGAPGLGSDDWAFRQMGIPALVVSDTKELRSRAGEDRFEAVDFESLTRIVMALEVGLGALGDRELLDPRQ
jgi:hypothetical protein